MSTTDSYTYSSDNESAAEYVDLIGFDNYEILAAEPFTIRRKDTKRVVSETVNKNSGYVQVKLSTSFCVSTCKGAISQDARRVLSLYDQTVSTVTVVLLITQPVKIQPILVGVGKTAP